MNNSDNYKMIFRNHAIQRMYQRRISIEDVKELLNKGEVIEDYPDDFPYPSRLLFGYINNRPLHMVSAKDEEDKVEIIITVYEPDITKWNEDFRRRK